MQAEKQAGAQTERRAVAQAEKQAGALAEVQAKKQIEAETGSPESQKSS